MKYQVDIKVISRVCSVERFFFQYNIEWKPQNIKQFMYYDLKCPK